MVLQPLADLLELVVGLGQLLAHVRDRVRRADAGDDVLALGVGQVLAEETFSPVLGSRVNATPVPESSPMLPKTMVTTLTAVPRSCAMLLKLR